MGAFLSFGAGAAFGQQNCAPRGIIVDRLAETFGESRQAIGMAQQGRVVEVFASLETGTWTITITLPSGVTCLVASGESYENLNEELQPAGIRS
ncbi:MAG: hypothetical protein ACR2OY_04330 [Boseongicola sp.]